MGLGIAPAKTVLLVFGSLAERKGILQVMDAVARVPHSVGAKLCLLLVGRLDDTDRGRLQQAISRAVATSPAQIIQRSEFVAEREVQAYFHAADLVLAPYQRHVGMSGIQIRAAAAGRPVLASDLGLVGQLTRQHKLGRVVDAASATAIAEAISAFVESPERSAGFDRAAALRFASEHSEERYGSVLLATLLR